MNLKEKVERWAFFLRTIRQFFDSKGFFEVTTPLLIEAGAFESCIDTMKVQWQGGAGELNSSPEIEMKRLLAEASLPIYQLAKSFRDNPPTPIHFKEFTMLEYYKPGWKYQDMKALTRELVVSLSPQPLTFAEYTVQELVRLSTGIDIQEASTAPKLRLALEGIGFSLSHDDTWTDMFLKLLVERVEGWLDPTKPTFVTDYPAPLAALGAINPLTGFAERFELYWKGIELANGCSELTDSLELAKRFEDEKMARVKAGKAPHPYPSVLFQAFQTLPPCSGVAIGLDRLFLCLT